ncbi:sigma 54-interacting transcriptional regulator [Pendulispora albinea]|uniref:Sigma 54-interacting transcriptional regulator n=1 Tax=Pendulispora albinea TaxID=2741071 RepID=A0ABZ2LUQ2_9BACT
MTSTAVGEPRFVDVLGGTLIVGGKSIPIEPETTALIVREGADDFPEDSVVRIPIHDRKVSEIHAELTVTRDGVRIRDLRSTNGTVVDGVPVTEAFLRKGHRIRVGETELQFLPAAAATTVDLETDETFPPLVGTASSMRKFYRKLSRVAPTEFTVLVTGETGTGKELVAQAIHEASRRAKGPYVVIDCGAINLSLAESLLFGHKKGAYTGAADRQPSPFEDADGGTLFLDEIGELPLETQSRLLRVLQERQVKSVGDNFYRRVDVRIIAATRRNLEKEVNEGRFRVDLFHRLMVLQVQVPPLRDRLDDIPALVELFTRKLGHEGAFARISHESLLQMTTYDWPGNVRELLNVVARGLAFAPDVGPIHLELPKAGANPLEEQANTYPVALLAFKRAYWTNVHTLCGGKYKNMVSLAGLSKTAISKHLAVLGLSKDSKG